MEYTILNNGIKMPMEGYGVFQIADPVECEQAVLEAIKAGYRLIDTAAVYGNEEAVGTAIKKCGIAREELFITTKLWVQDTGYEATKKAFRTSLDKLGLDYLDLYLVHQPIGDYYSSYRAMEELYKEGKIKALGVSNFYPDRLVDLCLNVEVTPAVNQVEIHPFFQQEFALSIMKEYKVQAEAWGPLAEGKQGLFTNTMLQEIADKYNKSIAQIVLRWNTQRGVVIIPKSAKQERIIENIDIWDFELSQEEMNKIFALDLGHSEIVDHTNPVFIKNMSGYKIHE
jgi:diketogulonate reductase-like aldo/keto reductase